MIGIERLRGALADVDGALEGEPRNASSTPAGPHRVVWLPHEAAPLEAIHANEPVRSRSQQPQSHLAPFLDLPAQSEAELGQALAQMQPEGTLLGTPLGDVSAENIAEWHPFHELGGQWGVYFSASRLLGYAKALFPKTHLRNSLPFVWKYVLHHELFHFGLEYAAAQLECVSGTAIFWNAQDVFCLLSEAEEDGAFYNMREEALCNAYALRRMASGRPALRNGRERLKRQMAKEGPGYRDGLKYETDRDFEAGVRNYILTAVSFAGPDGKPLVESKAWEGFDLMGLLPLRGEVPEGAAPILILDDYAEHGLPPFTIGVQPFTSLTVVEESPNFRKRLAKLDHVVRKQWEAQKRRLAQRTTFGFELWQRTPDGPVYSVRVGDNFRAHILVVDPATKAVALDIGTHKSMGHG